MIINILLYRVFPHPLTTPRETDMPNESTRFLLIPIVTVLTLTFLLAYPSQARLVDKVVAIVNGEVVTSTELDQASQAIFTKLRQTTPSAKLEEALAKARQETLTEMIEDLLIAQKAREFEIEVTNEEITAAIERISSDNGMTVAQLYKELGKSNVNEEEYRRKLGSQIRRSKLLNYEVGSRIVISEEKARQYYDTVYTKREIAAGYHIMQIGFTWGAPESSSSTREGASQRAENIRKMVLEGQDFRELARSFSDLPSGKDGGELGFFKEDEMAAHMRGIIVDLQPGQVSNVVEASGSFQFFLLLDRNIGGKAEFAPFEFVNDQIQDKLGQEELKTNYGKWMKELWDQALIKELL
jgi:peptidyl-prolyl cis-trans isomerase SurA